MCLVNVFFLVAIRIKILVMQMCIILSCFCVFSFTAEIFFSTLFEHSSNINAIRFQKKKRKEKKSDVISGELLFALVSFFRVLSRCEVSHINKINVYKHMVFFFLSKNLSILHVHLHIISQIPTKFHGILCYVLEEFR